LVGDINLEIMAVREGSPFSMVEPENIYRQHNVLQLESQGGHSLLSIQVVQPLRVGRYQPSQLVLAVACSVNNVSALQGASQESPPDGVVFVAKCIDPAYSQGTRENYSITPKNRVEAARELSGNEATTYQLLHAVQGSVVPRFYGQYLYRIVSPTPNESRDINVILLEYFDGKPLSDPLTVQALSPIRVDVARETKRLLDVIHSFGVYHNDVLGHNILAREIQGIWEYRLIDFEFAAFLSPEIYGASEQRAYYDIGALEGELEELGYIDEGVTLI
jgi:serine/threonine protein kinase